MPGIGVVPENPEIRSFCFHPRQTGDDLIRISNAGGVAILGNAPDSLDGFIRRHQLFDEIHIGSVLPDRNGDHFYIIKFTNGKNAGHNQGWDKGT